MTISNDQLDRLYRATVVDSDGDKIGSVGQIYLDDQTDRPTWATVNTGFFGTKETFVPLDDAQITDDEIRVPFTKQFVKDAPNIDDDGHIDDAQQAELYKYYSSNEGFVASTGRDRESFKDRVEGDIDRAEGRHEEHHAERELRHDERRFGRDVRQDERDAARLGGDAEAITRHEEELRVGKERIAAGQVRLRKHVVTEQKTVSVPVEREEVQVVREPITDGGAVRDAKLGEEEVAVTLTEERPVVEKEVVAKERIGLDKQVVTDEQQVQAEVAREEVEVVRDGDRDRDGQIG